MRGVFKVFVASAVMLTACGMSEPPLQENRSGQSAIEARSESPSKRPAWLPQDIPLPQDLVIFETSRMKLQFDDNASYSLEGYSWQNLYGVSGNRLAPGTVAHMQVNPAGDHVVISLSIIPQG